MNKNMIKYISFIMNKNMIKYMKKLKCITHNVTYYGNLLQRDYFK